MSESRKVEMARRFGAVAVTLSALAGCASQPASTSDFNQVTLGPGETRGCVTDPCTILFQMPPGDGTYTVRTNNQVAASAAAGTVANLGGFYHFDSPVRITVDGLAVAEAVVFITPEY